MALSSVLQACSPLDKCKFDHGILLSRSQATFVSISSSFFLGFSFFVLDKLSSFRTFVLSFFSTISFIFVVFGSLLSFNGKHDRRK